MAKLEISHFTPFQVLLNNLPVTHFDSIKAHTLVADLVAEPIQPQPAESLAALPSLD